jgi:hypothetical protein
MALSFYFWNSSGLRIGSKAKPWKENIPPEMKRLQMSGLIAELFSPWLVSMALPNG